MNRTLTIPAELYDSLDHAARVEGLDSVVDFLTRLSASFSLGGSAPAAKAKSPDEDFSDLLGSVRYESEEDLLAPIEDAWEADPRRAGRGESPARTTSLRSPYHGVEPNWDDTP